MAKSTKRLSAKKRRIQILQCAVKVFARSNYRVATVAQIASEAGISEAMIYKHFPSKKAIFLEILNHVSERTVIFGQEEVAKEEDALTAIKNMGLTYYRRIVERPDELKVQFQAISETDDSEIASRLRQDHATYMLFIREVLEKGVRQGSIRSDLDVDSMVWVFNGVANTMNMTKILSFEEDFTEDTVRGLIDNIIDYLRA